jgi:hypothetical protein
MLQRRYTENLCILLPRVSSVLEPSWNHRQVKLANPNLEDVVRTIPVRMIMGEKRHERLRSLVAAIETRRGVNSFTVYNYVLKTFYFIFVPFRKDV